VQSNNNITIDSKSSYSKLSGFFKLTKFRLSLLVVFSAVVSYFTVSNTADWKKIIALSIGGMLVTAAANAYNQVIERNLDKLMKRTQNRPLPTEVLTPNESIIFATICAVIGCSSLFIYTNTLCGLLSVLSIILYALVYTPLKRVTPFSVFVGAIPGALPTLIGAIAIEDGFGKITPFALFLYAIQFFWQFPHFWAVAWVADEDYKKGGFYLLPSKNGEKDATTGFLSFIFCLMMVGNAALGYFLGYVGLIATLVLCALNIWWALKCWKLYKTCSREAARTQMFVSFAHLPLSLIVLLLDKI
jgi:protoheme IX farnesyltransferase